MEQLDKKERIEALADKVLKVVKDSLVVHLRFLDIAIHSMGMIPKYDIKLKGATVGGGMATDGLNVYYDPVWILKTYEKEPNLVARTYLHMLLHLIFFHPFKYDKLDMQMWDLASDAAVSATIQSMKLSFVMIEKDAEIEERLAVLKRQAGALTAERIYQYLRVNGISESGLREWFLLYHGDEHIYWRPKTEIKVIEERWLKISERVKAELKSFSKDGAGSEELEGNLNDATKERYDYGELLRRFMSQGEDMKVNDDEFDYIYYTYGMDTYGNMPLVEPLEYRDSKKVREFVIAIDTSASVKGAVVRAFLKKTYSILKSSDNFFNKVNIHVIQCDADIQEDTKITDEYDFDKFCKNVTLKGFGSTDFRPVFKYVDELKKQGEFENLKGVIYFTDGYGTYPESMPEYDALFAFLKDDPYAPELPKWAYKVILEPEELEAEEIRREEDKRKRLENEHKSG